MEEINSLDAAVRRLSNYARTRLGMTMNEDYQCIMLQPGEESGSVGSMKDVTSEYPPNMDTLTRLEIRTPCSSDAAFRILCTREHIRHITVAGRTYSRQEIACMEAGRPLGGRDSDAARPVGDVPFDAPPPPRRGQIFTATEIGEADLNTIGGIPIIRPAGPWVPYTPPEPGRPDNPVGANPTQEPFWYETVRTQRITDPAYAEAMDAMMQARQHIQTMAPSTFDIARQQMAQPLANPTPVDTLMQTMGVTREVAEEMIRDYNRNSITRVQDPTVHFATGMAIRNEDTHF